MSWFGNMSSTAAVALIAGAIGGMSLVPYNAFAMGSEPQEAQIDCSRKINKTKPECFCKIDKNKNDPICTQKSGSLNDDQLYQSGYWLAKSGKYQEAITQLKLAKNQNDPRILNYLGYSNRKLGHINEALGYYRQALSVNPDYTLARAYLGEAFLQQGRLDLARGQLQEIKRRCGTSCVEFTELSGQIASFEATGTFNPQG